MKNDQDSNAGQTLRAIILHFAALGCSIIPTLGKLPAVAWKMFRRRAATPEELGNWFGSQRSRPYHAAALITGHVSKLIVLDFDTPDAFDAFQKALPELTETYIVKTRRGFHVYLQMPSDLPVPHSQSRKDLDLQGPGRYVIMEGSTVDGYTYRRYLGHDATADDQYPPIQLREVTARDLNRLQDYLETLPGRNGEKEQPPPFVRPYVPPIAQKPAAGRSLPDLASYKRTTDEPYTLDEIQNLYRTFAPQAGRNNTLFYITCLGRDSGFLLDEMKAALTHLHVRQPPPFGHPRETPTQRRREAHRTIASAFSYPVRPIRKRVVTETPQLSNAIREELLRRKHTNVIRVIEGLRLKGITPGQSFTERDALETLNGTVGRHSIRGALGALADVLRTSPHTPLQSAYGVASECSLSTELYCIKFGAQKPDKTQATGRPPQVYVMPSNQDLAAWLGVKDTFVGDPLLLEDLQTAKKTRQALHRRFIERKPGTYSHSLMQMRLGVCRRTVQNYNDEDPDIIRTFQYHSTALNWSNFKYAMPDEPPHRGCFIKDKHGNHYPYQHKIVVELLKKRQEPHYCRQIANDYHYRASRALTRHKIQVEEPPKPQPRIFPMPRIRYIEVKPPTKSAKPTSKQGKKPQNPQSPPERTNEPSSFGGKAKQRPDRESYREPLPDEVEEAVAQRVRKEINAMTENPKDHVTIVAMRRLVWRHRTEPVLKSMAVVRKRRNVRKPIGFLSTILRCGDYR